jgi:signal transduction histidine kinase
MRDILTIDAFYTKLNPLLINENELARLNNSMNSDFIDIIKGTFSIKSLQNDDIIVYYTSKPIYDYMKNKIATLLTFFDMTDIYELYQKLENKNTELMDANRRLQIHIKTVQQLTTETERNKIMADIHDTLGHSMMELLALLEVSDLVIEQNEGDILEIIQEAIDKGRDSLTEVREAVSKYKKMGGMT